MILNTNIIQENDLPAMHAILSICGEHMYRTQGMSHWYPFRELEKFRTETSTADVYAVYDDTLLVGTFYLTSKMRDWYKPVTWQNPEHQALYFGGFGVLPLAQGRGIGKWTMQQVNEIAKNSSYDALRFDGVASNLPLMKFYDNLGYQQQGLLPTPNGLNVMVFERIFEETL